MSHNPLLCIAHRGGRALGTENTLDTVAKALRLGVDGIEIDVWQVGQELLVTHDRELGRVIRGEGRLLDVSPDQLQALKNTDDSPVVRLQQVLELVGDKAFLNIELKGPGCAPAVADVVDRFCRRQKFSTDNYIISSYDHSQLYWLQKHAPIIRRGVLVYGIPHDGVACCDALGAYSFHPSIDFINKSLVSKARGMGLQVWVYTVNREDDFADLSAMGVHGVFTDFPEQLLVFNEASRGYG